MALLMKGSDAGYLLPCPWNKYGWRMSDTQAGLFRIHLKFVGEALIPDKH